MAKTSAETRFPLRASSTRLYKFDILLKLVIVIHFNTFQYISIHFNTFQPFVLIEFQLKVWTIRCYLLSWNSYLAVKLLPFSISSAAWGLICIHDSYWPTLTSPENSEPFQFQSMLMFWRRAEDQLLFVSELNTSPGRVPLTRRHSSTTNLVLQCIPLRPIVPMSDVNVCLSLSFATGRQMVSISTSGALNKLATQVRECCHDLP